MTPAQLDVMLLESGLAPDEAGDLATLLAPLADPVEAPSPSADLLALFGEDAPTGAERATRLRPQRRHGRARGAVAGVVVLAISGVGATGLSAAANTLPTPWQHQVSDFSRQYLPFVFPQPRERSPQGLRASGAGPDDARSAGKVRHGGAVRGTAEVTEGSRSLGGDRDATSDVPSRSGRPRADRPGTASATVEPGPTAAASPSAAPAYLVKPTPTPQSAPVSGDGTSDDTGKNSGKGPDSPSKSPTKTPSKSPSKSPTKAPDQGAGQGQKPDKGHDPVVGPKGPQNGPKGGPSSGPKSGPGGDQGQTPGGTDPGGDQGDNPPREETEQGNDDGGVTEPVERVLTVVTDALGGR